MMFTLEEQYGVNEKDYNQLSKNLPLKKRRELDIWLLKASRLNQIDIYRSTNSSNALALIYLIDKKIDKKELVNS